MYQVEKAIPMPPRFGSGRPSIYPFNQMDVGDSFVVSVDDITNVGRAITTYQNKYRSTGVKFSRRRVDNDNYRIWRVA